MLKAAMVKAAMLTSLMLMISDVLNPEGVKHRDMLNYSFAQNAH